MRRMYPMTNDVPQAKLGLLAAVMIGMLAVSVALAWMATKPPKNTSQGGAEIISKLAADTLEGYWTGAQRTSWFIGLMRDVQPIGWQMRSRLRESEGMFSGALVDGSVGASPHKSSWRTKADLSESLYVARMPAESGRVVETRIILTDSEVTVVRSSGERKITATAARPDNYVPEGTFPLVLRLAAARGREATVKMIFDANAIAGKTVRFVNARLMPRGDNAVRVEYSGHGFVSSTVYHLDGDYNLYRYEYPARGIIYRLCEEELVTKTFHISDRGPTSQAAPQIKSVE